MDYGRAVEMSELLCSPPMIRTSLIPLCCTQAAWMYTCTSYCTIDGFKLLATNYLNIEGDHRLYRQIEGLLKNVEVTPAEIAEELLKSGGTDVVLRGVVKFLEQKERQKAKAAVIKELLKSADIDVDAEGLVKFLKQKKIEDAKAAEANCINPNES